MRVNALAKWEQKLRPLITKLPPKAVVSMYSSGRLDFLKALERESEALDNGYFPPPEFARTLWGIEFRSPIMNAAGMFKNGECYRLSALQGAGGYIRGTGTWNARHGNEKEGIYLPFVPYHKSHAASNFLGLPNDGDEANAERLPDDMKRINGCPLGQSVMGSPDLGGRDKLRRLVDSMWLYEPKVDFLEINESCPNTEEGTPQATGLANRLSYIADWFLYRRERRLPVIVKFSNDTELEQVPALMDLLFEFGFDGVNFGNTSTDYGAMRKMIHPSERKLYDFYTQTFGGGGSGAPLREKSLALCARAVEYMRAGPPSQEFHAVRTGGIENWQDLQDSENAGVPLNHWFTGYFDNFARHGHDVYRKILTEWLKNTAPR